METAYVQTLYQDFDKIVKTVKRYSDRVSQHTDQLEDQTKTWANLLNKKYLAVSQGSHTEAPIKASGDMALETTPHKKNDNPISQQDFQQMDIEIDQSSKNLNYNFQKAKDELQFLVQSYSEMEEIINNIWDAWDDLIGANTP